MHSTTCALHLSQATSNTFALQTLDFPNGKLMVLSRRREQEHSKHTSTRKTGRRLEACFVLLNHCSRSSWNGNLKLGKWGQRCQICQHCWSTVKWEAIIVSLVLTWPIVTPYQSHISRLTSTVWAFSCGSTKKHQLLTQARKTAPVSPVGQEPAQTPLLNYWQSLTG